MSVRVMVMEVESKDYIGKSKGQRSRVRVMLLGVKVMEVEGKGFLF